MESFLSRHGDKIKGVLSGFDRIVFGGSIQAISYADGLEKYLGAKGIRFKDFRAYARRATEQLVDHAKTFAQQQGRPYKYLSSWRQSKEEMVDGLQAADPVTEGLICVLSCVESCRTLEIRRTKHGPGFVSVEHRCAALYFYFEDRDFGRMYVRIQSWWPFPIQLYVNGRSFLARRLAREGIGFVQYDNCLVDVDDIERAQQILDELHQLRWQGTLDHFARLTNPLVSSLLADQRGYFWTFRQSEHATDVLFKDRAALGPLYANLVRYAITHFGAKDVLRFLGRKPHASFKGEVTSHRGERIEGVRVKHRVRTNSVKMYDKGGSVLRIETTINDPREMRVARDERRDGKARAYRPMRKGISDTHVRVQAAHAANQRYLEALSVVGNDTPSSQVLDPVNRRVTRKQRHYRPLHPAEPQDVRVLTALLDARYRARGFSNRDLTNDLNPRPAPNRREAGRRSAKTTRLLALLRAHSIIRKLPRQSRYQLTSRGIEVATAALSARNTPVAPMLEASAA